MSNATIGGSCSSEMPARASAARERFDLRGAEPFGEARDLGADGLAMVRQCDELHRERDARGSELSSQSVRSETSPSIARSNRARFSSARRRKTSRKRSSIVRK